MLPPIANAGANLLDVDEKRQSAQVQRARKQQLPAVAEPLVN
jgi:hypothetical protein